MPDGSRRGGKKKEMIEVSGPTAQAVREFTYAHKDGYRKEDLEALRLYIRDLYGESISIEGLSALVEQARIEFKARAVNEDMESILFSPDRPVPKFKLGSAFCSKCSRFKNYKKECPFCGYHEITV